MGMKEIIIAYDENAEESPVMGDWVGKLVRCKDCRHGFRLDDTNYIVCCRPFASNRETHTEDWFCADGVRK